jgi:glutamate N-acetyltransferase/amino-acid N-acetyltransferase
MSVSTLAKQNANITTANNNKPKKVSPLAPTHFPKMRSVPGVKVGGVNCGIRYQGRPDLFVASMAPGTVAAGVFTKSKTAGAPVIWCRDILKHSSARVIVVNAGNANAFTGKLGMEAIEATVAKAAEVFGCKQEEVFVASTGVIGEPLPYQKITAALPRLAEEITPTSWETAARAIMTTDTYAKASSAECEIDGVKIAISGIAKGSGMIAPNMATLLAYAFTDANIAQPVLQQLLQSTNTASFNSITVDGDTSTSDMALLFATKQAKHAEITDANDARLKPFKKALRSLMIDLAQQVVMDGEGAEKFITVRVKGAESIREARKIALTIANSPLVKTAIAGEDANWGRIAAAVGRSATNLDPDRMSIAIGGVVIAENGERVRGYNEAPVVRHIKGRDILLEVDLKLGDKKATVWTCDLTHGYIDINGSYRT